jgi:excisionase family DNA binding protein
MNRLLTAEEIAERLNVPTSWVYSAARNGELPAVRLGRYVRFDESDVADWVDAQRAQRNGKAQRDVA